MSKKLLVVLAVMVIGLFMTTSAMADLPGEAKAILLHEFPGGVGSGNSAATILNPEGKGDVLIYPYYDVRELNGGKEQDFLFAIINNEWEGCQDLLLTPPAQCYDGVAAKLRFREWDKSEEVFDVDIWLSRGDVWVGQITHDLGVALPYGAKITSPNFVITAASANTFTLGTPLAAGFDFPTTAFVPPGSSNLYGYTEVIGEERTYDHQSANSVTRVSASANATVTINGVVFPIFPGSKPDVPNELMGYGYLVRVADGQSMAYNAKAIANFNDSDGFSQFTLFSAPGSGFPQLTQAEDFLESIEFQMAKEDLFAAYDIEAVINGQTSLIVTFPTKHFHFCPKPNYSAIWTGGGGIPAGYCTAPPAGQLPTPPWTPTDLTVGVHNANTPEVYGITIWDRHENQVTTTCYVSPCPPGESVGFPYEVNILGFYTGSPPAVPATGNRNNLTISTTTFDSGWASIFFPNLGTPLQLQAFFNFGIFYGDVFSQLAGYSGLPAFAMTLQEYSNGSVGGWYGDIRDAWYETEWVNRTAGASAAGGF